MLGEIVRRSRSAGLKELVLRLLLLLLLFMALADVGMMIE